MGIRLTQRDFLAGKIVEPAFYLVNIDDVEKELSKAGDSTNYILKGTIIKNFDSGSTEFAGVPTPRWAFNSKAPGFFIPLYLSMGIEVKPDDEIEPLTLKGMQAVVFIKNDTYEDRPVNSLGKVPQYRPLNG